MPSSKAQFAPFRGIHLQLQKPINWKTAEGTTGVAMFLRASGFEGLGLGKSIGNGGRLVRLLTKRQALMLATRALAPRLQRGLYFNPFH